MGPVLKEGGEGETSDGGLREGGRSKSKGGGRNQPEPRGRGKKYLNQGGGKWAGFEGKGERSSHKGGLLGTQQFQRVGMRKRKKKGSSLEEKTKKTNSRGPFLGRKERTDIADRRKKERDVSLVQWRRGRGAGLRGKRGGFFWFFKKKRPL